MLSTTYREIITPFTSDTLIRTLENFTGSRYAYGLDTPLTISAILAGAGLTAALECFYYAQGDVTQLSQAIGFAFCEAYQPIWDALTGGLDSRYQQALYFAGLLQQVQLAASAGISTARLDYCGDPLDSYGAVTVAQVEGRIASLQATAAAQPVTHTAPPYPVQASNFQFSYDQAPDGEPIPVQIVPIPNGKGGNLTPADLVDDPIYDGNGLPPRGYIETPYADDLKKDPDFFLKLVLAQRGKRTQNKTWGNWYPLSNPQVSDPESIARANMANAAALAAQQVTTGAQNLLAIAQLIQQGVTNYAVWQRLDLLPQMNYLQGLALGASTPYLPIPGTEDLVQQVIDAENASIVAKLRDPAFIGSFDLDYSQGISPTEFSAMLAVLDPIMLTARNEAALPLFLSAQERFYGLVNMQADLSSILAMYVA